MTTDTDFEEVMEREPPPPMGHNSGDLKSLLQRNYNKLSARSLELQAALATLPDKILSENEQKKAINLAAMVKTALDEAEKARVTEKRPYLDGERTVDFYFAGVSEPLEEGARRLRQRMGEFLKTHGESVRSDEGALASHKMAWAAVIDDFGKVDLKRLHKFFTDECIQKAVDRWLKTNLKKVEAGTALLPGVRFSESVKVKLRR